MIGSKLPEPSPDLFDEMDVVDPAIVDAAADHGEIVIVGTEECPNCGAIKQLFGEELGSDRVRYVDVGSPEGRQIDTLFGQITAVPFITYHDRKSDAYTECVLQAESIDEHDPDAGWTWNIDCDVTDPAKTRIMPRSD